VFIMDSWGHMSLHLEAGSTKMSQSLGHVEVKAGP